VTISSSDSQLIFICLVGIGGSALGLSGLLLGCHVRTRHLIVGSSILSLFLAALAGVALAQAQPRDVWLSALSLAGACAAFPALHSPRCSAVWSWVLALLRDPRCLGCLVLLLSILTLAAWAYRLEEGAPPSDDFSNPHRAPSAGSVEEIVPSPVCTDRGEPIRVGRWIDSDLSPSAAQGQATALTGDRGPDNAIRVGPADPRYNCHGWTFCAGRYVLPGDQVPIILEQNGYQRISDPGPGDLAVYRQEGKIVHTGVVRAACSDTSLLVESKWGELGRFIHPANLMPYGGASCEYYRSWRSGHSLRGLDGAASPGSDNHLDRSESPALMPAPSAKS
jgi:hypothetical protein